MGTEQIITRLAEVLWMGGLAATPLAVVVWLVSRARSIRPATRHMLWVAVLASFVTPAIGTIIWHPHWFRSDRLIAAADSVLSDTARMAEPPSMTPAVRPEPAIAPDAVPVEAHRLPIVQAPLQRAASHGIDLGASVIEAAQFPPLRTLHPSPPARKAPSTVTPPARSDSAPTSRKVKPTSKYESAPATAAAPAPAPFVGPMPVPVPAAERIVPALATMPLAGSAPLKSIDTSSSTPPPSEADRPVRAWLVRLLNIRDAIASLPPIPAAVWFGGAVLIIVLSIWRRCMGMLWLRRAVPAGPHVQATVRQVADALGLSRVPRVVFVNEAVSPMIWCGLRPLLVLPTSLWRTLDEDSRRAVLVHELAHVRRWDHVWGWLEAAVGVLYWWHPVVWWVRRRLHEEAEASCDTWVTSLFPGHRRAYASALLVTKSFVSSRAASRGPWLGVASGSAKRLARRITMVMTHKSAPRMSVLGVLVTTLVVATGTFVMPSFACPPEEEGKVKTTQHVKKSGQHKPAKAPVAEVPGTPFFGEAPALEAMRARGQNAPTPPAAPAPPTGARAPRAPMAPMPAPAVTPMPAPRAAVALDLEALKEGREPRTYKLSEGKLEAFYGMMSRSDVPILVQMEDGGIIIWGTDDEHAVFSKFVKIVDGDARPAGASVRGRALTRADVEELAKAGRVRALASEREAAQAQREALRESNRDREALERSLRARAERDAAAAGRDAERSAQRALETASAAQDRELQARIRQLESHLKQLEKRAEKLEGQLDDAPRGRPASPGAMSPTPAAASAGGCESTCKSSS